MLPLRAGLEKLSSSSSKSKTSIQGSPQSAVESRQAHVKQDVHYTTFIRLPFPRGDFVDPPLVDWDASKDRALWKILSSNPGSVEIDWRNLASTFEVTLPFILQQAAWLYERQLSQVRAQMRKVGTSSTAPASPLLDTISATGEQRRESQGSLERGAGPLSMAPGQKHDGPSSKANTSGLNTANVAAASAISRNASARAVVQIQRSLAANPPEQMQNSSPTSIPLPPGATDIMREGDKREDLKSSSPSEPSSPASSSSNSQSQKGNLRSVAFRRPQRFTAGRTSIPVENDDDDAGDDPAFLPFSKASESEQPQDLGATLRTVPRKAPGSRSESNTSSANPLQTADSTASSDTSSTAAAAAATSENHPASQRPTVPVISRHRNQLAKLRGRGANKEGSDGTPSMGSSFSDLDDASVTQSALEEALMSNMQQTGGARSRMSTISQALKSRYYDA